MFDGRNLKAKVCVRLVCPICDQDLPCYVKDLEISPLNWVLTEKSTKHLAEAHA